MKAQIRRCPYCKDPIKEIRGRFVTFECGTMMSVSPEEVAHAMQEGQEEKKEEKAEKVKPGDP